MTVKYKYLIETSDNNGRSWKKVKEYLTERGAKNYLDEEYRYQQMGWIDPDIRYRVRTVKRK